MTCMIGSSCMDGIGHWVSGVHLGCTWLDIPRNVATGGSMPLFMDMVGQNGV